MPSSFSKGSDCTTVHLQKYSVPEYTMYFPPHIQCLPPFQFPNFIYYLFGGGGSQLQHTGSSCVLWDLIIAAHTLSAVVPGLSSSGAQA